MKMKLKNIMLISLVLLVFLTISAASATDNSVTISNSYYAATNVDSNMNFGGGKSFIKFCKYLC